MADQVTLKELRKYSITTGTVLDAKYLMAVLTNDARLADDPDDRHSYFAVRRGKKWYLLDLPYAVRSQAIASTPERCIISVTDQGIVRRSAPTGGDEEAEVGEASGRQVEGRSRLSEVRTIGDKVYTAGTRRAVYRRTGPDVWECIDRDCYDPENLTLTFQSVHGFSDSEVYAVGAEGELWEFDGRHWQQHDTGTNVMLHKVLCTPDGIAYAVGRKGTILRGRHAAWQQVPAIPSRYEFWSVQDYGGRLFLSANNRLALELRGDRLSRVDFGECPVPGYVYHLTVGDGCLYTFGAKDIRKFDGNEWEEVLTLD